MSPFANKRGRKPCDNSDGGLENNYLANINCIPTCLLSQYAHLFFVG